MNQIQIMSYIRIAHRLHQIIKNRQFKYYLLIHQTMDKQKLQQKLKSISQKNKKLLQSISTHLINNPDELQSKLHEHRYLQQKYNELIGFSRENVERYEKVQAILLVKEEEIKRLNQKLGEAKDSSGAKLENLEKQYRRKRGKDEEEIDTLKNQNMVLKKQLQQQKQGHKKQKQKLQHQLQTYKKQFTEHKAEHEKQSNRIHHLQKQQQQGKQKHEKQRQEFLKRIKSLQEQNVRIRRNNKIDSLNEIRADLSSFKNRNRDEEQSSSTHEDNLKKKEKGKKIKETLEIY